VTRPASSCVVLHRPTPSPGAVCWPRQRIAAKLRAPHPPLEITTMGKYFVGWLLGVPVFVLVIVYFFFS
jgi:hypothetical protein